MKLTPEQMLATMRRAGDVAARVLGELWPDGSGRLIESTNDIWFFVRTVERAGIRVRRTGELQGSWLGDTIELGGRQPCALPRGATQLEPGPEIRPGTVSVGIPRAHWWQLVRPAPTYWSEAEVEKHCRRLNAIGALVIGVMESRCRVCGLDEGAARYIGGEPEYVICNCCECESGVDDLFPAWVARARREWLEKGRHWRYPKERPADWDPDAALAALPPKWRDL